MLAQDNNRSTRSAIIIGLALFGTTFGLLVIFPYYLSQYQQFQHHQEELLLQEKVSPQLVQRCHALGAEGLSDCAIWQAFVEQYFAAREAVEAEKMTQVYSTMPIFFSMPVISAATIFVAAYEIRRIWEEKRGWRNNVYATLGLAGIMAAAIYVTWFFLLIITIKD
jgi:hypothetical protein